MRDWWAKSFVVFGLIACGREQTVDRPVTIPPPSEVECEPDEEPSEELCAVLCEVPGGVEECPVGTPCRARAPAPGEPEAVVRGSLCSLQDTGKSCLTPR